MQKKIPTKTALSVLLFLLILLGHLAGVRMTMLTYSLIGAVTIVAASFVTRTEDKYADVCVAAALPIFIMLPVALLSGYIRPATIDGALRSADMLLRLDSFAFSRFCAAHTQVYWILSPVYAALPFALAVAWIVTKSRVLLSACVIGPALAFVFYLLVPACGPLYAFPHWPASDLQVVQPAMIFPRNCFPSMHLGWALLLALNTKGFWRWTFLIYSVLMALATVAGGQHYFMDVIAAVPFVFAVQAIACRKFQGGEVPLHVQPETD
jgi:PAP2 superfamily